MRILFDALLTATFIGFGLLWIAIVIVSDLIPPGGMNPIAQRSMALLGFELMAGGIAGMIAIALMNIRFFAGQLLNASWLVWAHAWVFGLLANLFQTDAGVSVYIEPGFITPMKDLAKWLFLGGICLGIVQLVTLRMKNRARKS